MKKLILGLMAIALFTGCEDADDNMNIIPSSNTALIYAQETPELSIFNQALFLTGLDATLSSRTQITVLAPTNDAFNDFLMQNSLADISEVSVTDLRALLLYHIMNDEFLEESQTSGYLKTRARNETADQLDIYLDAENDFMFNGVELDANVPGKDVDNGYVFVIPSVLELPTLQTFVAIDPNLSNLQSGLVQENLTDVLGTQDGTLDPFTLLAPSNDAFTNFIAADDMDAFNDVDDILAISNLSDVLQFHLISGLALRSENIDDDDVLDPITAGTYTIDGSGASSRIEVNGVDTAGFTTVDITAVNGVMHLIDNILIP